MIKIKKGDTHEALVVTLIKNGEPVDFTKLVDYKVLFYMRGKVNGKQAQIIDKQNGKVMFSFEESVVNESGYFDAEFKIIYRDGRKDTFPDDGFISIRIYDDLEVR